MDKKTVTINGTIYDAHTGMPIQKTGAAVPSSEVHHSQDMHRVTQKSQTLNRRTVKKTPPHIVSSMHKGAKQMDIRRSGAITKFAPRTAAAKAPEKPATPDVAAISHPMVTKAHKQLAAKRPSVAMAPKPAGVIKQEAISQALEKAPSHAANHKEHKRTRRFPRLLSVGTASLALLLLGGYFTYLNMPSLSVRVAAAQAGVNASYPQYRPDGYSLKGPVAYSQGQVTMKFAANAGPQGFTVNQSKSNWDSSAVLDNYVKQKAGDNYITYTDHGLTIYTFNGNAAWVNGGILYTIDGDAPLSGDQIRHIATSM